MLINYADGKSIEAQKRNSKTALEVAGFEAVISFNRKYLDAKFKVRNREILAHRQSAGFWLWTPYIVARTLREMRDGDNFFIATAVAISCGRSRQRSNCA